MASETHAEGFHVPPLGIRQYIYITLFLGAVTVVELALSYSGWSTSVFVPMLIILSALKFGLYRLSGSLAFWMLENRSWVAELRR